MPLYKQSEVPVDGVVIKYTRAELMCLYNNEIPRVECHEQERSIYPDGSIRNAPGEKLIFEMTDPSVLIPIINPETYEQTEATFSAGQFALMAASVYIWMAMNRDAAKAAPKTPPAE